MRRRCSDGARRAGGSEAADTRSAGAGHGAIRRRSTVFETMITVVGNVVDSPRKGRANNGSVTNFRVASTPRRFDSTAQRFVDGETFFVDVECWGDLSNHVSGSVGAGDPVVVVGAISTSEWETDAGRRSKPRIRARVVGHNLHWGISKFTKLPKASASLGAESSAESSAEQTPTDLPVDPSDEEFGDSVDQFTGELLRGRDYVTDPATLHDLTADDLGIEPAHA
jgi:single-strand DNA-binding protein